jgi:hypothetical protein
MSIKQPPKQRPARPTKPDHSAEIAEMKEYCAKMAADWSEDDRIEAGLEILYSLNAPPQLVIELHRRIKKGPTITISFESPNLRDRHDVLTDDFRDVVGQRHQRSPHLRL